ncbi:MAG: indole-3-glycerol-phosphate synthase [Bacteroidales bacterium]|nr:indole-3-glycerol-phosphate synthase [Bacteroidales bacterium]
MDILDKILETKRQELRFGKRRSLRQALLVSETGIIAEFKRKSPSKGWIHPEAVPEQVVPAYAAAGAAALSILTDESYFGGSLDFIRRVRPLVDIPILRKDFIIDPVQLVEARQAGADAVLLIAACMSRTDCASLTAEARRLGLEVLLEIHSADELDYITPDVDVVGVNNRHLGSFVTDVQTSFDLAPLLASQTDRNYFPDKFAEKPISAPPFTTPTLAAGPSKRSAAGGPGGTPPGLSGTGRLPATPVFVSESGISDPATVRALRDAGYRGFLMGEHFMRQPDPGAALAAFIQAL